MTATTVDTHEILARRDFPFRDGGPDARAVGIEEMDGAWQACLHLDPSGADGAVDRFPLHAPDGEVLLLNCHADTLDHVARTVCEMWARQA